METSSSVLLALLGRLCSLDLLGAPELLCAILALFPQFARWFVNFLLQTRPNQPMFRLEFSLRCLVIVYKNEARALSSTKLCSETERDNPFLFSFVHGSNLFRKVGF